jgi:outer membrane protein assembly factor BamB
MHRSRSVSLLALVVLFVAGGSAAGETIESAEWTQWRGPDRANLSPDTGLVKDWNAKPPKLVYDATGLGEGYAGVAVAGGKVYTTGGIDGGQGAIALDAATGKILWKRQLIDFSPRHGNYSGSRCTPSIDGDRLYVIASSGLIACLNIEDGKVVWSKDFVREWSGQMMSGWGFSESPLVDGEWVLCTPGGPDAMVVALNKLTGEEIWRAKSELKGGAGKEGAAYSSIVVSHAGGVKQYVQLVGRGLIGIRASDGKYLWGYAEIANRTASIPTPLVSGDFIFTSTGYGTGAALLKLVPDGEGIACQEQYFLNADQLQNHHGGMVLVDGYVYCGHRHNQGFPICVELATGKTMWGGETRGPGSGSAAIVYADGHLVFRYQNGEVALIEATPAEYRLKGSFRPVHVGEKACWAHPVVIGGKLYLRDQDHLMCYDLRESPAE